MVGAAAGLAGIAAFLAALSYAELVAMCPRAGAEHHFLKAAFPKTPLVSFMAGFLVALNAVATSAKVSLAFAGHLNVFVQVPPC